MRLRKGSTASEPESEAGLLSVKEEKREAERHKRQSSWQRILLLIIAITIHNIPGIFIMCSVVIV